MGTTKIPLYPTKALPSWLLSWKGAFLHYLLRHWQGACFSVMLSFMSRMVQPGFPQLELMCPVCKQSPHDHFFLIKGKIQLHSFSHSLSCFSSIPCFHPLMPPKFIACFSIIFIVCLLIFPPRAEDQTQGLVLSRLVLYHYAKPQPHVHIYNPVVLHVWIN